MQDPVGYHTARTDVHVGVEFPDGARRTIVRSSLSHGHVLSDVARTSDRVTSRDHSKAVGLPTVMDDV